MNNKKIGYKIRKILARELGNLGMRDKIIEPPSMENNVPVVYYAFLDNIEFINSTNHNDSLDLPESLIISRGKYNFYNNTYDLRKEGLYRFVFPGKENQQRIVYEKDVDALLSSISWIYSHGNSDDNKKYSEINVKALHSKIFATCGSISEWASRLLGSLGIRARIVSSLTLESWNSYDNGHILLEVYRKDYDKWVVYDLDNDTYFSNNGISLSLIEFAECAANGNYKINHIANNINLDISNYRDSKTNYDFAFLIEARFANENSLKQWYKRVMQVPLIGDDKYNYFFNNSDVSRIERYSSYYKYMDKQKFIEKFY